MRVPLSRGARAVSACVLAGLIPCAGRAEACTVCTSLDPTLSAPGAELPFARRLRLDAGALAGAVSEQAPDGRLLTVSDLRLSATAAMAVTPDLLLSASVPVLQRTLSDGDARPASWVAGDAQVAALATLWRGQVAGWRRSIALLSGLDLPTAPLADDARGQPLPAQLQPGCSALVPRLGLAYALSRGALSARGSVVVELPFDVRTAPHRGDALRGAAWVQAQPTAVLATRLGLAVRVEGTGELSPGVADLNSGGLVGSVTTDVVLSPAPDVVVSLGASFPAVQALYGVQHETAVGAAAVAYDF